MVTPACVFGKSHDVEEAGAANGDSYRLQLSHIPVILIMVYHWVVYACSGVGEDEEVEEMRKRIDNG